MLSLSQKKTLNNTYFVSKLGFDFREVKLTFLPKQVEGDKLS